VNLTIFLILLGITLTFIILGYKLNDSADIFKVVGFGFLFVLSVMIIPGTPGNLEYPVGVEITETETGYITSDVIETYEDFFIGFFMTMTAIFGFINVFASRKGSGGFGQDD
jgi:hypothetical protein